MIRFSIYITLIFLACSCNQTDNKSIDSNIQENSTAETISYTFKTIETDNGWGYVILNNGVDYIKQPHIPAVNGMQTFQDQYEAEKVAEYIVTKLNDGIFPPTISIEELDRLGIKYNP